MEKRFTLNTAPHYLRGYDNQEGEWFDFGNLQSARTAIDRLNTLEAENAALKARCEKLENALQGARVFILLLSNTEEISRLECVEQARRLDAALAEEPHE